MNPAFNKIYSHDRDTKAHIYLYNEDEDGLYSYIMNVSNPNYCDIPNTLGQTPMHIAGILGFSTSIRRLILSGVTPTAQDFRGDTVLHKVVKSCDMNCVSAILDKFSWSEYIEHAEQLCYNLKTVPCIPIGVDIFNDSGLTALHLAIKYGNIPIIEKLLCAGADVNMPTKCDGDLPIHLAIRRNDVSCQCI